MSAKKQRCDDVDFAVIERAAEPIIVDVDDHDVQCLAVRKLVTFKEPTLAYGQTPDDMAELGEVFDLLEEPTIDTPLPGRKMRALLVERLPVDPHPTGWVAPYVPYGQVDVVLSSMTALLHSMPSARDPAADPYPLPAKWVFLPQGW
jgi:hypothetical protein